MKKFVQKLGIIAASGLVFGILAGVSFTGVKSGIEYVAETISGHSEEEKTVEAE